MLMASCRDGEGFPPVTPTPGDVPPHSKTEPAPEEGQALFSSLYLPEGNISVGYYPAAWGAMAEARRWAKKKPTTLAANTA